MKKVILSILFFFMLLQIQAQGNRGNTGKILQQSMNNIFRNKLISGDTLWLYHRYDINKWTDSGFVTNYTSFIDYYPGSANMLSIMWTKYVTDTLYKEIYQYDEQNRIVSTIRLVTLGNSLVNYIKTDKYYDKNGYDSLYVYYTWNENDSIWVKDKLRGITHDEYDHLLKDTTAVWNGQEWKLEQGYKRDYVLNDFGNVLNSITSFYNNYESAWIRSSKYDFYLINDTTGLFNGYTIYVWQNNKWENYEKFTNVILHNWNGWDPNDLIWETEYLVLQRWDGNQWYYRKKDSIIYYDNGGNQINEFFWDEENNDWLYSVRVNQLNNDNGFRSLVTYEEWDGNSWDTIQGGRFYYEYFRPELWRVMHYERYDTATSVWGPAYDHVISDFSYVLNTTKIKSEMPSGFRIIPNPSDSNIQVRLNDKTQEIKSVEVFDMSGRILFEKRFGRKQWRVNINISQLKSGTYIVIVKTTNGRQMRDKFIKN